MKVQRIRSVPEKANNATVLVPICDLLGNGLREILKPYGINSADKISRDIERLKKDEIILYPGIRGVNKLVLLYTGEKEHVRQWKEKAMKAVVRIRPVPQELILDLRGVEDHFTAEQLAPLISSLLMGSCIGRYDMKLSFESLSSNWISYDLVQIISANQSKESIQNLGNEIGIIAEAVGSILDLVNHPSNRKNTEDLAQWAQDSSGTYGYRCEVLAAEDLKALGMHALLAVNRGSEIPAKCIILHYTPENMENAIRVGLVGKGVTFDSGGLSIKGSKNLHYMKSDMAGAAAVMGAIEAVSRLKLDIEAIGVIPVTDNSVDARAIKPGDVIGSYHGSTIEVIDTDAEGRLILADGLAYANRIYRPKYLIDVATLTGSVVRALGTNTGGLMTNNDALANSLIDAGEIVGERLWRLPVWKEHRDMMHSDLADIKNLSDKPVAGALTAAAFLQHFIDGHPAWAHLDIAGVAFGSNPLSKGYSATGFGVQLLVEWMKNLT